MRVLYVEDNATNVILVQRVANMGKHEVVNYGDGQVALDRFTVDKPDLILLDVQLRGALTGLDVAHSLRVRGCTVPIIAVTAYAMKGDRQRCLDAGCDDYLPKPISVAELVTVFKRYADAVAAGKPIESTAKVSPTSVASSAIAALPVVVTPTPIATLDEKPEAPAPAATTIPSKPETESEPMQPAVPQVTAVSNPLPVLTDMPSTDSLEQRTPTPANAEP